MPVEALLLHNLQVLHGYVCVHQYLVYKYHRDNFSLKINFLGISDWSGIFH